MEITFLYGTETGNAQVSKNRAIEIENHSQFELPMQDVAVDFSLICSRYNFKSKVSSLQNMIAASLQGKSTVIFVVSTTGDGDPPASMKDFWLSMLQKDLSPNYLAHLNFGIFGLGDSSYAKFNSVARKLRVRILNLGGKELCERGLGDDQSIYGLQGDVHAWSKILLSGLLILNPLPSDFILDTSPLKPESCDECNYPITSFDSSAYSSSLKFNPPQGSAPPHTYFPEKGIIFGRVIKNERLTSEDWIQDVRHLDIDFSEYKEVKYTPGDIAAVYFENIKDGDNVIKKTAITLGLDVNAWFSGISRFPSPCSVRELLTKYLDIYGVPKRHFFEMLSTFATVEEEKSKLVELSTPEGADLFFEYVIREKRTYLEVFEQFPSARPPFNYLINMIPTIKSRLFSISSSFNACKTYLSLTVATVKYSTFNRRIKEGLCSSWLNSRKAGDVVPLYIVKGSMRLPEDISKPLIFIGPGTGVAPFRSMIQERCLQYSSMDEISSTMSLYFGCRHERKDFLYESFWQNLVKEKRLSSFYTAFSRDSDSLKKTYVQQRVEENGEEIANALAKGGYIYIAGNSKMPICVLEALETVLIEWCALEKEKAKEYIVKLQRNNRLVIEAW